MKKELGGKRLGSGSKMEVQMHNYERSTHDLSKVWRSTMGTGTLVPFMTQIGLNGDTFEIDMNAAIHTLPTSGPLFGAFKVQYDIFSVPIRLYNAKLHNNAIGVGMDMAKIKLPKKKISIATGNYSSDDIENETLKGMLEWKFIDQSSLIAYTGLRALPANNTGGTQVYPLQALFELSYYDTFKCYYANKQEKNCYMITPDIQEGNSTDAVWMYDQAGNNLFSLNAAGDLPTPIKLNDVYKIVVSNNVMLIGLHLEINGTWQLIAIGDLGRIENSYTVILDEKWKQCTVDAVETLANSTGELTLQAFPLQNIDDMRDWILTRPTAQEVYIEDFDKTPYKELTQRLNSTGKYTFSYPNSGLMVKTYQSDLLNNWIQTEWIDGTNGISAITKVSTSTGGFTIDALNLANKVYNMLNRIAISGGTYEDWQEAVYGEEAIRKAETPIYCGGMSCKIEFQELVSTAESGENPQGTLAGKGNATNFKGGSVKIKVKEPSVILGLASITPYIDYSQGNKWFIDLKTMNDLHKPALDGIGFQELLTKQMAGWDSELTSTGELKKSAGKQPAWINYMTDYNECYGNFAHPRREMYMTLNRRYGAKWNETRNVPTITDVTTYIDPRKYDYPFAQRGLGSQNFWVQIAMRIKARRKISAKIIPNL